MRRLLYFSFKQIVFIILTLSVFGGFGQDSLNAEPPSRWRLFTHDIGSVFGGMGYAYARPLDWESRQWKQAGAVTLGTGLLYLIDDNVSRFVSNQRERIPQRVRDYGTFYGGPNNNLLFSGAVMTTGIIFRKEKMRRAGVLMLSSGMAAGLFQQATKYLVGRARPVAGLGKDTFKPFSNQRNFHSFFSGHTTLAFTTAYALGKQFKNPWVKGAIYGVGLVPGVSRVWDKQHWITDFVIGVAISVATVEAINRYLDRRYDEKYTSNTKKTKWNLNLGVGTLGFRMSF